MLVKIENLGKNVISLKPPNVSECNTKGLIEEIRSIIKNENCKNLVLDLTNQNFLNTVKIGVLIATYHFVDFINGKIYLVVNDEHVSKYIETFNPNNIEVIHCSSQTFNIA